MIKSGLASVDISTMKRLPWIDFDIILENTEAEKREKVILDILQNNLPDSADDIYYIYHDENTNMYSIKVDENSEEVQNFISSILLISARLKVEDLSDKERRTLIRKRNMKIKELRKTFGAYVAADLLESKLTEEEKREAEEKILEIQEKINEDGDNYYYIFNKETNEFELRFEQDTEIIYQIVAEILKLDNKIVLEDGSPSRRRETYKVKNKFINHLRKMGADTLADSLE